LMNRLSYILILGICLLITCSQLQAAERFPPPEFENHVLPETTVPAPHQDIYEYIDVAVLFAALCLASYLVLKKRNRRYIFALMIFSLIYFGFWRKGCVCSIGALQNVALSLFDSNYAIPIGVLLFFLLPLIFTLFFGRMFCAAVCPLGAIQDVFLLKPIPVPRWLENALRLFAYVYLAVAILFAITGSAFIICRYDPFISLFRLSGSLNMLVLGGCVLLIGVFIGRPYCRFICPYGVILRQLSRVSRQQVTITPDDCIKCRLCEDACPFGAITRPTHQWPQTDYSMNKKRLAFFIVLLPVLVLLCGWAGNALSGSASRVHVTVRLAERIYAEDAGDVKDTTDASLAFRATGKPVKELYSEADVIREKFALDGCLLGAFLGLVIGIKLIGSTIQWHREDYQADRAGCVACGRCFQYCPREHDRLKKLNEHSK